MKVEEKFKKNYLSFINLEKKLYGVIGPFNLYLTEEQQPSKRTTSSSNNADVDLGSSLGSC